MLSSFTLKKTFYNTRVVISVDCECKQADALVMRDGLIIGQQPLRFNDFSTPERAQVELSRQISQYGNWIETLHATLKLCDSETIAA